MGDFVFSGFLSAAEIEARVSEAWGRLATAELAGGTRRQLEGLEGLEEAYHAEMQTYQASLARE